MSVFIIAEVAQTHDGSLGLAHAFIDAVAKTGANAIKFQTHFAEAESSSGDEFRTAFSFQDKTRFEYWKRMEWNREQWLGLKKHAEENGLVFLSSAFSKKAFELLESIGVSAWKVGSGEVMSRSLLECLIKTRKPLYFSTGMSTFEELDQVVHLLRSGLSPFTLMQCSSVYPCPPEKLGFNVLSEFRKRYECPVGFSDHSGSIFPSIAAVTLGASAIEVHVTLSREMFGPDVTSSVTTSELKEMVQGVRLIERGLESPVEKDRMALELSSMKKLFGKAAYIERDLKAGSCLSYTDVQFKKPVLGITDWDFQIFLGKKTKRDLKKGDPIQPEDLDL